MHYMLTLQMCFVFLGVFAAIAISLVLFGILLGTLTSCGVVVACFYKRKKMKETSSSSENGQYIPLFVFQ